MKDTKNSHNNNFNGPIKFNGPGQIAGRDIINFINGEKKVQMKVAEYTPEPVWRSPFTLAVLSWASLIIGIVGLVPTSQIFRNFLNVFNGNINEIIGFSIQFNASFLAVIILFLTLVLGLRGVVKKQIRIPLVFDYAISGMEKRIVIEKIKLGKCPICGGKMKYYNKPIEWRESYIDGKMKREVIKRVPALECKRNSEHWFEVDPAEEKIM